MLTSGAEAKDEFGWQVGQEVLKSEGDYWHDAGDDPVWRWLRLTPAALDVDSSWSAGPLAP
jgi:hypothetical protein